MERELSRRRQLLGASLFFQAKNNGEYAQEGFLLQCGTNRFQIARESFSQAGKIVYASLKSSYWMQKMPSRGTFHLIHAENCILRQTGENAQNPSCQMRFFVPNGYRSSKASNRRPFTQGLFSPL